jgi:hypothetical protein
MKAQNLEKALK